MLFTYNNTSSELIEVVSINEFIKIFKYNIDDLYIDKFWDSLNNDDYIVIDYDMLEWMGYTNTRLRDARSSYISILENNFIQPDDYEIVSTIKNKDARIPIRIKNSSQSKVILIKILRFKESLMLIQTERSKTIRRYFITLESILKNYIDYTRKIELNNRSDELIPFDIDKTPMKLTEYVYVLTSNRYYRKCMFKIGKSINPLTRLISHNTTSALDDDTMYYTHIIPTFDCSALEKLLHKLLSRYHHTKEWYHIQQRNLLYIIEIVIHDQKLLLNKVNNGLLMDEHIPIPLNEFIQTGTTDNIEINTNENPMKINKHKKYVCNICNKEYISLIPFNKHIDTCKVKTKQIYNCQTCERQFKSKKPYDNHIKVCGKEIQSPFKCDICDRCFTTERRYNNHTINGCVYNIKCNHCDKTCSGKTQLLTHIQNCHP